MGLRVCQVCHKPEHLIATKAYLIEAIPMPLRGSSRCLQVIDSSVKEDPGLRGLLSSLNLPSTRPQRLLVLHHHRDPSLQGHPAARAQQKSQVITLQMTVPPKYLSSLQFPSEQPSTANPNTPSISCRETDNHRLDLLSYRPCLTTYKSAPGRT
jgi:hypothetical protein